MQTRIKLSNPLAEPRVITLEPWGGQYDLPPRDELELRVDHKEVSRLEIEFVPDGIIIAATEEGMDLTIFRAGQQVRAR